MSIVRLKRLQADYLKLKEYVRRHPRVQLVQAAGDPPEAYQLRFQVASLRQKDDRLVRADDHLVEIALPRHYPRTPPQCRMLTPVFHPNIAPHAICIGDHWSAGESLSHLVARIGEMLAYQSYNTKSPLNGEAARWAADHADRLPLDPVSLVPDDDGPPADLGPAAAFAASVPVVVAAEEVPTVLPVVEEIPAPAAVVAAPLAPLPSFKFPCPTCAAVLHVPAEALGRSGRCTRCKNPVRVPDVLPSDGL